VQYVNLLIIESDAFWCIGRKIKVRTQARALERLALAVSAHVQGEKAFGKFAKGRHVLKTH
jgi:hypothetical protein